MIIMMIILINVIVICRLQLLWETVIRGRYIITGTAPSQIFSTALRVHYKKYTNCSEENGLAQCMDLSPMWIYL